jgi:hypothetical protein
MESYDLYTFWTAIGEAMSPKGMAKAMGCARCMSELAALKQEQEEQVSSYASRFSKKVDELQSQEGAEISESVLVCLFAIGLNDKYVGYRNHVQNKGEDECDFVSVREGAIRWTINEVPAPLMVTTTRTTGATKQASECKPRKGQSNRQYRARRQERKRECFACGSSEHMVMDCPRVNRAPVVAAALGGATTTKGTAMAAAAASSDNEEGDRSP